MKRSLPFLHASPSRRAPTLLPSHETATHCFSPQTPRPVPRSPSLVCRLRAPDNPVPSLTRSRLYSNRAISKIRSAVEYTARLQEHQLVHFQDATRSHYSLPNTMTTRLETIERQLILKTPDIPSPKARGPPERSSRKPIGSSPFQASESFRIPRACTRDCRCQCHETSTLATPRWVRSAVGSLILQYNGVFSFNSRPAALQHVTQEAKDRPGQITCSLRGLFGGVCLYPWLGTR